MEKLTQEEIRILKQMVLERLSRENSPKKIHLKRAQTKPKTVRLSAPLLEMALAKEANFSALVERLVFEWLGSPEELQE